MHHGEYRESVDVDFLLCKSRPFSAIKGQVPSITDLKLVREPVVEKDAVRLYLAVLFPDPLSVLILCLYKQVFPA